MGFFSGQGAAATKPAKGTAEYERHRQNARARQQKISAAGRDIGPIPAVADPKRRKRCLESLEAFGRTYFAERFNLKLSKIHKGYIADLERIVKHGGRLAVAMPRGSGKSSWAEVAVVWAIFRGNHRYVLLLSATQGMARKQLATIRKLLLERPLLTADFPEVCYPLACHRGVNQRRLLSEGRSLTMEITSERILLPDVPGATASEAIIECLGLSGAIRGRAYERTDGARARPTLVIADDPQTKATAKSQKQTEAREELLKADVAGLAGPDQAIAIIMPCTVIYPDDLADRLLDRERNPAWNGRRTKLLDALPDEGAMELWNKFQEIRAEGLRQGDNGAAGTKVYRANRKAMDAGAKPTWPERFAPGQLSAVQYAMEIYFDSRQTFYSEYQNDPAGAIEDDGGSLDPGDLMRRTNGLKRGRLPSAAEYIAAGVDVHGDLLYVTTAAAELDPTIAVVDYWTWPRQVLGYFSKRGATRTMKNHPELKSLDPEARLYRALTLLADELLAQEYERRAGEKLKVGLVVIDARYMTEVVTRWCKQSPHSRLLLPVMGSPKLEDFGRRLAPGTRPGVDYHVPPQGKWPVRVGQMNSNAWITRTINGFLTPMGSRGAWTLFQGENSETHRCFADHITAESSTDWMDKKTGQTHRIWTPKPDHPDNHWLDATKMAALGCFELGCKLAYVEKRDATKKKAPRVSYH